MKTLVGIIFCCAVVFAPNFVGAVAGSNIESGCAEHIHEMIRPSYGQYPEPIDPKD